MARYRLLAYCNECGRLDRMDRIIKLDEGPTDLQSIGDAYKGKILPSDLADLTSLVVTCRQTGKRFNQPDYYQIFLDPTADDS
jgi:hypothetical protein